MQKKIFTVTPLFIALSLVEVLLILFSINYLFLNNNGGNALGGTIAFFGAIINFVLILIQQAIANIKNINRDILYGIEILIIITATVLFYINGISIG